MPSRHPIPSFQRNAFILFLALWVLFPLGLRGTLAQDAIPYVAVGHLAHHHPKSIYAAKHGNIFDLDQRYFDAYCRAAPKDVHCDDFAVAFVAAPPLIPITIALSWFGNDVGPLLMQFGASILLAAGMWVLWKKLAHRTRTAPSLLVATVVLLTPMAMVPIGLGQTSPILFFSLCVGLMPQTSHRKVLQAMSWAAAVLLKLFPAALVVLLIAKREWRILGIAVGVFAALSIGTLLVVPVATWGDFVRTTLALNGATTVTNYNGSIASLGARILSPAFGTVIALFGAGIICWFGMRKTAPNVQWAAGYLALVVLTPLVWWHYLWVGIGAIAVALAARRQLSDRAIALLPVAAIATLPSIRFASGGSPLPVVQALILIGFCAAFCVIAQRSVRDLVQREPEFGESGR